MIYLDTNIFIHALGNPDKKVNACINLLDKILNNKIEAYTSFLTWDEFLQIIKRQMEMDKAISESQKFLNFPNLIFLDVNEKVMSKAQELVLRYNLKPRDAIHAATAIVGGIKEIASDDTDFDRVKELKRIKI
ncbi:MAG: type II toxin-antitoxin system VapC family toxin [Candidatus Pacearchaeota archaeon]|nr:type II toxin-antitoxin system VapC family toxin [Candidatus Pacearchaeota archaeon]